MWRARLMFHIFCCCWRIDRMCVLPLIRDRLFGSVLPNRNCRIDLISAEETAGLLLPRGRIREHEKLTVSYSEFPIVSFSVFLFFLFFFFLWDWSGLGAHQTTGLVFQYLFVNREKVSITNTRKRNFFSTHSTLRKLHAYYR